MNFTSSHSSKRRHLNLFFLSKASRKYGLKETVFTVQNNRPEKESSDRLSTRILFTVTRNRINTSNITKYDRNNIKGKERGASKDSIKVNKINHFI